MSTDRRREYRISLTDAQAHQTDRFLAAIGADFDPPRHLTMLNSKSSREYALHGEDAPELIRLMNQELDENGLASRINLPKDRLTLQQAAAILELAWEAFDWGEDQIHGMVNGYATQREWDKIAADRPAIFEP